MEIDPNAGGSLYRTLAGAVIPRPIAWVSSRSADGVENLAPYSFFNVASVAPPVLMFSAGDTEDGLKDTPTNIRETEEFVVNIVTESVAEAMNETSATLPHGENEFDHVGLTRGESKTVNAPRVAESPVSFECSLYEMVDIGASTMVLGKVEWVHVDDDVTTDGKLDVDKIDAVGRLSGSLYTHTDDRFAMERPE